MLTPQALDAAAQAQARGIAQRIPLQPMSREGLALMLRLWAEEDAADARDARQDHVSQPSRFVGIQRDLPAGTTA